jgi:hypothetical protein
MFFIVGVYGVYRGIRAIKTQNIYWAAPTISGFKNRKNEKSPLWVATLTGISTILFGVFFIAMSILCWLG